LTNKAVADIGCADGDLGFFLESLGFEIDFLDWPATNWNGLRGVRRLVELLDSRAQVHAVNLDEYFALPRKQYELVLFLGILYHLKNPFYVLEQLAKSAKYCFVSTRVFRAAPSGEDLSAINVAYLLAADESENGDATNYWIMTAPCLRACSTGPAGRARFHDGRRAARIQSAFDSEGRARVRSASQPGCRLNDAFTRTCLDGRPQQRERIGSQR